MDAILSPVHTITRGSDKVLTDGFKSQRAVRATEDARGYESVR